MVVLLDELKLATKGGIYALAQDTQAGPFPIKVGRSVDFKKRLNSYFTCFNDGFRVIALLPLKDNTPMANRLKLSTELEKDAKNLLGVSRYYANRRSRGSEWYFTDVDSIHRLFNRLHKSFHKGKYTKTPIIKFNDNFLTIFNIEGIRTTPMHVKFMDENKIVIKKKTKKMVKKVDMTGYKKKKK